MPFNVGPVELIIVLVIALLVIGPRRLPEMGNAVGKTIREFRKASSDISEATSLEPEAKATTPAPTAATSAVSTTPAAAPAAEASVSATASAEPAEDAPTADSKSDDA